MPGVVDLWEAELGRPSVERGLLLASVSADAPVGARNAALLDLRRRLFGPSVEALARCPACGEASEISFSLDDLVGGASRGGVFEFEGLTVEWRLPNSLDLAFAMRFSDEAEAARAIARRCVVSSEPLSPPGERGRGEGPVSSVESAPGLTPTLPSPSGEGEAFGPLTPCPSPPEGRGELLLDPGGVPEGSRGSQTPGKAVIESDPGGVAEASGTRDPSGVGNGAANSGGLRPPATFWDPSGVDDAFVEALGRHMDAHDPLAAPTFSVACPECGAPSEFLLDLVEFVGREIATAARRALADVHELARAYGWTEAEVLALSPVRRRMYLEMVRA